MSLPSLTALPTELHALVAHGRDALHAALDDAGRAVLAAWPPERQAALERALGASDFVAEQAAREPRMLLELAASSELERSLAEGELRAQLVAALEGCDGEDELARRLRRYRNRQQCRIIWRDVNRLADLAETCGDLSALADASIDLAYHWLYERQCAQSGTPVGARSGEAQHLVILGMGKLGAFEHCLQRRRIAQRLLADEVAAGAGTRQGLAPGRRPVLHGQIGLGTCGQGAQ